MTSPIRILYLEDNGLDVELIRAALTDASVQHDLKSVSTRDNFVRCLEAERFDLILSDHDLRGFDGISALRLVLEKNASVPFIFVTGSLGEEMAVETIRQGATDYVLKDRLWRLVPAIRRALGEAEDRQARQRAERALRISNERFSKAFRSSPVGISIATFADGRFLVINDAFVRILGYPREEVIGRTSVDLGLFARPEDRSKLVDMLLSEGAIHNLEVRIRTKYGRPAETICSFELLEMGGERCILAWIIDITERKRAEHRVREQAALLDEARDAIIVLDLDQRVTYWNKGSERLYGWTSDETMGQRTSELFAQGRMAPHDEANRCAVEKGEWAGELSQVNKAGDEVVVESRKTLLRDDSGRPKAILVINTDISQKKKLEAQFLRSQRMENLGELAGGIAHDLNNVLAPILMAIDLLKLKTSQPADLKLLETLESSAQRGASMVKQILLFARGTSGPRAAVRCDLLISDLAKVLRDIFPPSIQISTRLGRETWAVTGEPTQLYQVLMNLCVNARDAMPEGGRLLIGCENALLDESYTAAHPEAKPGPYVVVTVSDTGGGIPPEIQRKIFEPFFTTKELGKGSGLGLSTVMSITKGHGGFVTLCSELNKGAHFRVYFPATADKEIPLATGEVKECLRGNNELVLVVDDEQTVREITLGTLENYGYRVVTANDGTEAIGLYALHRQAIRAVITDVSMPFMDGPATIRAIRKIDPGVKIIAVSGRMRDRRVAELSSTTGTRFLQKPYTSEQLLAELHQALNGRNEAASGIGDRG